MTAQRDRFVTLISGYIGGIGLILWIQGNLVLGIGLTLISYFGEARFRTAPHP